MSPPRSAVRRIIPPAPRSSNAPRDFAAIARVKHPFRCSRLFCDGTELSALSFCSCGLCVSASLRSDHAGFALGSLSGPAERSVSAAQPEPRPLARSGSRARARGATVLSVYREWLRGCAGMVAGMVAGGCAPISSWLRDGCAFPVFRWLRDGCGVGGATSETVTLVALEATIVGVTQT